MKLDSAQVIPIESNVEILVHDVVTGELLKRMAYHNLVPLVARDQIRDFLFSGAAGGNISHFAVGTGTNDPASSDTALQTEVYRAALTKKTSSSGQVGYQQYLGSAEANGNTLTEAGLFNQAAGGMLFARVKHQTLAKTAAITVTYNWTININAG